MSLENVKDAKGRLDVVAYRVAEKAIQELETYWGCSGLWDLCKTNVEAGIRDIGLKKVPEPFLDVFRNLMAARAAKR